MNGDSFASVPRRWRSIDTSSTAKNAWFGHAEHLTFGFSQIPRRHSFAQAGAQALRPPVPFSQRVGKTSGRPRKNPRNKAIFCLLVEFLSIGSPRFAERAAFIEPGPTLSL